MGQSESVGGLNAGEWRQIACDPQTQFPRRNPYATRTLEHRFSGQQLDEYELQFGSGE
jgi:hypothetical protein